MVTATEVMRCHREKFFFNLKHVYQPLIMLSLPSEQRVSEVTAHLSDATSGEGNDSFATIKSFTFSHIMMILFCSIIFALNIFFCRLLFCMWKQTKLDFCYSFINFYYGFDWKKGGEKTRCDCRLHEYQHLPIFLYHNFREAFISLALCHAHLKGTHAKHSRGKRTAAANQTTSDNSIKREW